MKKWPNFGSNSDISALFGEDANTQYAVQESSSDIENSVKEQVDTALGNDTKTSRKRNKTVAEKLTQYRSAKYSDRQIEQLEKIKEALSTTNDGEALRWALDAAYKANKRKIERIVEEKQRIESL